jgi:hypothetical protein
VQFSLTLLQYLLDSIIHFCGGVRVEGDVEA